MLFNYPRDPLWRSYLVDESRIHGARFSVPMLLDLINLYTKELDVVLDPMGGVGSILIAATLGRRAMMIELEERFVGLAYLNRDKLLKEYGVSPDRMVIMKGNSRHILPLPPRLVTHIITSPPYSDAMRKEDPTEAKLRQYFGSTYAQGYTKVGEESNPHQIGNLPHQLQRFALRDMYQRCYETLSPGGRLIIVSKDTVKAGKRVEQGTSTLRVCYEIGFELEARDYRQCQLTPNQRIHKKRDPNYKPIDVEDIFVFQKRGGND